MLKRKKWDVNEFNKVNLPEVVGTLSNKELFSKFNRVRVLDMPIYMPNQGWKIPENLNQFLEPLSLAIESERRYGNFEKDHYVYVTVDQKVVHAGKTGRRAGAHSDAYVEEHGEQFDITTENAEVVSKEKGEVSHTYIVADTAPTEFFNAKFPLTDTSCEGSLKTFDEIANNAEVVQYGSYTLLKLDPYVVHRCSIIKETSERTFMKISISKKKYARSGNTINPDFIYDWEMKARSPSERNHPW